MPSLWMPANGALHGIALDQLMKINLIAVALLFVVAHILLGLAFLKRRKSTLPRLLFIEILPLIALCGLYLWMAITAQQLWAANRFEGPSLTAMQVEVVGVQFQWYFRYPGEDATFGTTQPQLVNAGAGNPLGLDPQDSLGNDDIVSSELILPAGREVDLRLTCPRRDPRLLHPRHEAQAKRRPRPHPARSLHPDNTGRISNPLHPGLRTRPRPHGSQTPRRIRS